MEERTGLVLRHRETGLYFGWNTKSADTLYKAWRWKDWQELGVWLEASIYAPEFPDEYETVDVEMTIQIKG